MGDQTPAWKSRIVGQGTENPDQLLANPLNWRIHPRHQQEALEGVLSEVGWVQQVIVNQRTGHVVDGHLRVALALRREEPEVPVLYVDLSDDEERLIIAALDPIAALAVTDQSQVAEILNGLGAASRQDALGDLLRSVADGQLKAMQLLSEKPFDATKLPDAQKEGESESTFAIYIVFEDRSQLNEALSLLTFGKRDAKLPAHASLATITGSDLLEKWREALSA